MTTEICSLLSFSSEFYYFTAVVLILWLLCFSKQVFSHESLFAKAMAANKMWLHYRWLTWKRLDGLSGGPYTVQFENHFPKLNINEPSSQLGPELTFRSQSRLNTLVLTTTKKNKKELLVSWFGNVVECLQPHHNIHLLSICNKRLLQIIFLKSLTKTGIPIP